MIAGRTGAVGTVTTARAGLRSTAVQSPPTRLGPAWGPAKTVRQLPEATGAMVAAVGLALGSLVDSFDDNFTDLALWPNSFGTYSETGGRARVSCDAGFNAYSSALTYRLAESSMFLRVYPPAAGGATTEAWTQILVKQMTNGTDLGFEISPFSGNLTMFSRVGFFDAGAVAIPYDAAAHAWLRIRETGSTVYWDTSPDTLTWTNQRALASPTWVTDPNLEFQLIAHRSDGTTDYAEFDNLNVPVNVVQGAASLAATAGLSAAGALGAAGSASITGTAGLSAAGIRATSGATATTFTAGLSAAGTRAASSTSSVAVTAGLTAAGSAGTSGAASLTATVGLSSDGTVLKASGASLTAAAALSSGGQLGAAAGAGLTAAAALTASGSAGRRTDGALAGGVALTAGGALGTASGSSVAVSVALQASGQVAAAVVRGSARAAAGTGPTAKRGTPTVPTARGGTL
ncbi:hypothetical protein [Streptomyces mirabilis]|uniref:hypothetical protein n=1 Tax=Streptomyces mirabilis TaxID=68239 RepID=UPI00367C8590